jgi:hypothetical protein
MLGDVRAVIFDPVTSYLGKVDSHKNADVRAVLDPPGEMAARIKPEKSGFEAGWVWALPKMP